MQTGTLCYFMLSHVADNQHLLSVTVGKTVSLTPAVSRTKHLTHVISFSVPFVKHNTHLLVSVYQSAPCQIKVAGASGSVFD